MRKAALFTLGFLFLIGMNAISTAAHIHHAPKKGVRFLEPHAHGKKPVAVTQKFKIQFGAYGTKIVRSGQGKPGDVTTGHHHILIYNKTTKKGHRSSDIWKNGKGKTVPVSKTSKHYGGGQTEDMLKLAPGNYILTLQLGDTNHVAFDPKIWSHEIHVSVK